MYETRYCALMICFTWSGKPFSGKVEWKTISTWLKVKQEKKTAYFWTKRQKPLWQHFYMEEKMSGNPYIFCSNRNSSAPMSRCQAYRIVRKAAEKIGLTDHVSRHSLRKTFGYHAWKQGTPPALLMSIYNHSSYRITRQYLCIEQEDKDKVFMDIKL